jgi:hypothetical protein
MNIQHSTFNIQRPVAAWWTRLITVFGFKHGGEDRLEQFKHESEAALHAPKSEVRIKKSALTPALSPRRGRNAPSVFTNHASMLNPHRLKSSIEMSPARHSFIGRWALDVGCSMFSTIA